MGRCLPDPGREILREKIVSRDPFKPGEDDRMDGVFQNGSLDAAGVIVINAYDGRDRDIGCGGT